MNIDPENQTFSEIRGVHTKETLNDNLHVLEADEASVVAISNSEKALRKLQDDLRKANYKKVK